MIVTGNLILFYNLGEFEMSAKKIYTCNICNMVINDRNQLLGVCFSDLEKFTLGGCGSTDGTHICYGCARQLREHLNNSEIVKYLDS